MDAHRFVAMRVLVGFDGSEGARDAVALTRRLCTGTTDSALLVTVLPEGDRESLEDARLGLGDVDVEARTCSDGAPAAALSALAYEEGADLIVVGSPHRGALGRALIGSVAEGLLHGASVPTVAAPRGYARREERPGIDLIAVAYDGSPGSRLALGCAEGLAGRTGATVRILTVAEPIAAIPGVAAYTPPPPTDPDELIEEAIRSVSSELRVEGMQLTGPTAARLAEACEDGIDILVAGSRGHGPAGRVLLGSVSTELIHRAPCPVLVVPRAVDGETAVAPGREHPPQAEPFVDRHEAGRRLAEQLRGVGANRPLVLALPRGGVPVASEIARVLEAPLEILAVRKLGAPSNSEYGIGAIAEDGTRLIDWEAIRVMRVHNGELQRITERERAELRRQVQAYRGDRPPPSVSGRTVILVDDGAATGLTDATAIRAVRRQHPGWLILALPVCSTDALQVLRGEADQVVCLRAPGSLQSVGQWYLDFRPVSDREVLNALRSPHVAAA